MRLDVQTHAQPDCNSNFIPVRPRPGVALQETPVLPAKAVTLKRERSGDGHRPKRSNSLLSGLNPK